MKTALWGGFFVPEPFRSFNQHFATQEVKMLDNTPQRELTEAVLGIGQNMPDTFQALRTRLHSLTLPHGYKVVGPWLVTAGAQVDITDGFFRTIDTVYLPVPAHWHNSDW